MWIPAIVFENARYLGDTKSAKMFTASFHVLLHTTSACRSDFCTLISRLFVEIPANFNFTGVLRVHVDINFSVAQKFIRMYNN